MRMWAKGTAGATLLTASFVAFGAGPALADVTNGDGSVLGGNQIHAPISVPVDVSGNSVAVIGRALAGSTGGSSVRGGGVGGFHGRTSGRHSIAGGNQIDAPISVPVNACGNAVAVIGRSLAGCRGGASVHGGGPGAYAGGGARTSGRHSIGGGNQVHAPISAPVDICGNSAAVIGDALAGCRGGANVRRAGGGGFGGRTSGAHSVLGGNQVHAPVNAPIAVCGNAVGNALAGCQGGAAVHGAGYYPGGGHGGRTSGAFSILGGNQVHAPVNAPIDVCGNAAAVLGRAVAGCAGALPGAGGYPGGGFHGRTSGWGSVGGGNQVHAPVNAPIDVCGNAAAVVGRAVGGCQGGTGGYGDDCITPSSARMSGLPQLPVDPASLRTGAMPVAMGATPALPKLPARPADLLGRSITPQSATNGPLGGLGVPVVGGPVKNLPPIGLSAAESPAGPTAGTGTGALVALLLGGMFAASVGTVSLARRFGRR
jgi:ChpA-C